MKVLVTGATGFVGREILARLKQAGCTSRIITRHSESELTQRLQAQYGAEIRTGDILEAATLTTAVRGVDAVIHLVGIISEVGKNTFENVHTAGTQNVVAAAKQAGVKRFVQMSALGTRVDAVARYHKSKWAAEAIVRSSGLDWTIFRPSIIYGPDDGFVNLFAKMSKFLPVIPLIGGGQTKMQPVSVADVATAFVKALTESKAVGKAYDLCGTEILTLEQIIDAILAVTRRRRWKVKVPWGLARLQAAFLEFVYPKLLHQAPPLNRDQLIMLGEDNTGNAAPAAELFGLKAGSFKEGIAGYLK